MGHPEELLHTPGKEEANDLVDECNGNDRTEVADILRRECRYDFREH